MHRLAITLIILLMTSGITALAENHNRISYCDHGSYPPLAWMQGTELRGVTRDSVTQIIEDHGYSIDIYVFESWKRCMLEVELGNIDLAVAFKTPERETKMVFSNEYLIAENMAIFVNKDHLFPFEDWSDLKNKQVGMVLGYSYGAKFDNFLKNNTNIERVASNFQNISKLALNRIDFVPFELHSGLLQVKTHGYQDQIIPLPKIATTDFLHLVTSQNNSLAIELLKSIEPSIKNIKQNGTIDRLFEQHRKAYLKLYPGKPSAAKPTDNLLIK